MLSDFKKILYVSDLDQGSRPAFRAAVSLCNQYDSKLTYLHVLESVSSTAKGILSNMMDKQEVEELLEKGLFKLRDKVQGRLERFCEQELQEHHTLKANQVDIRVEEGTPWKIILKVADEVDADVIVMGTRQNRTLEKFFLGSTASRTLSNSKRPVLVVPLAE